MIKSFIIESKWESTNILPILMKKLVISIIIYSKKNHNQQQKCVKFKCRLQSCDYQHHKLLFISDDLV